MTDEQRQPAYHGCGAVVFSAPADLKNGDRIQAAHILFPDGRRPRPGDMVEGCPRCGLAVTFGVSLGRPHGEA